MKKMCCLLLLCLLLILEGFSQELFIKARITDVDTMMVLINTIDKTDTLMITNGNFTYRRKLASPQFYTIVCVKNQQSIDAIKEGNERKMRRISDGTSRELFLENGTVTIESTFAGLGLANIVREKHSLQDKYDEFRKRFTPLVKMARTIIDSSYTPDLSKEGKGIYNMLFTRVNQIENETAEKFVTENIDNAAGAYVLYRYCRIENQSKLDSLYQLFHPDLKTTVYLKNIKEKIKALAALKPGQSAPFFTAETNEKQKIQLADLKEKYVVLDFWGSWCMPCISGFPKMKTYYAKYHDKIEFIGIACNDKDSEWKNAIAKYQLPWMHVFNPKGTEDLAVKYNVEAYPTKILIDKNGKFVQAFIGEGEDFYKKLDELLN